MPDSPPPVFGLELSTLLVVVRLGPAAYGAAIRREVSAAVGRNYSVGAIYTTLHRLEEKGLVRSWASDPLPARGGRSRRYFKLTARGLVACRTARKRYDQMWKGLTLHPRPT
jgi:DNA-binding PadR family transcriptional regulator